MPSPLTPHATSTSDSALITHPAELPTVIPITNADAETISSQPGPLWVLLSSVNQYGLIVEPELILMATPDPSSEAVERGKVTTGMAAAVLEIRQGGPQNLQRFYYVQIVGGQTGWVSDHYIRRLAYLYNDQAETVPLYAEPDPNTEASQIPNVSPIKLIDPTNPDWWQVETGDGNLQGWVEVKYVKESPNEEFLLYEQYSLDPKATPLEHQPHDN